MPVASLEPILAELLQRAVRELGLSPRGQAEPAVALESPRERAHGDLASSIAMQMASRLHRSPMEIARPLVERLRTLMQGSDLEWKIDRVEVKPPGFINFFVSQRFLHELLREILQLRKRYGHSEGGRGKRAVVEFVSANPTGPLSVAHGRQAAVGAAIANLLQATGYRVQREYYVNDEGTQMDLLGDSILARAREALGQPFDFPKDGYKGEYVRALGRAFAFSAQGRHIQGPKAGEAARAFGIQALLKGIRKQLERFGVRFDRWSHQSHLRRFGYLDRSLAALKRRGFLYESQGAWWLKSTAFGDDKDRVVIRSDGRLTYIASDIAYHRRKFGRRFSLLVNLWGPDHHGYIPRLKAAMEALGFPREALQIRIVQLCTLKRGGQAVRMSTREGEFTTLAEVIDEVGVDAARFFFLLRKADQHLEFDLELAKKHSLENPVYYIQYAHARIASVLSFARAQRSGPGRWLRGGRLLGVEALSGLTAPEELAVLRILREFPGVVRASAAALEPFGLVAYLQVLAEGLHRFYDAHRVVGPDEKLTAARLAFVRGVQVVLANGLHILGVSAPHKM